MAEERNKVADMQGKGFTAFVLFSLLFVLRPKAAMVVLSKKTTTKK